MKKMWFITALVLMSVAIPSFAAGKFEGTCNVYFHPKDDLPEKGNPVKVVLNAGDEITLSVKDGIRYSAAMTKYTEILELAATKADGTSIGKAWLSYDESVFSNPEVRVSLVTPDDMVLICTPRVR